ncbi:MAG: serine protein kinase [Chloroflexota bacterium]
MNHLGSNLVLEIQNMQDISAFKEQHWTGSFADYLELVKQKPLVARTAFQRLYDMIISYGSHTYTTLREELTHYNFFDDPFDDGADAVFGLDKQLMELVQIFQSAAQGYGTERRVLLLHGPVGSSKSTIVRLLKKGLERYTANDEGALYTLEWETPDGQMACPMHEDPLHLVPTNARPKIVAELMNGHQNGSTKENGSGSHNADNNGMGYTTVIRGELCPACRHVYRSLMATYEGDWSKVIEHVRVKRLVLSEQDRVGIGTFQPKDEKNQDSTELTGDINYRKIAEYGSDSDPRAFNFDGELNIANRGLVEFVEVLKLDVAFLYDLLTASQERKIKPKKFAQTDIDEVIIGHTNEPEYRKLLANDYMQALRDRTVKIDIPYVTRYSDEIQIYERDFNRKSVKAKHIAPHTLEVAAMWAVLTRLDEPKHATLTLMQKLKLYDGRSLPGFTEETVRELKSESPNEGMGGISPRYVQDKISNALVAYSDTDTLNPFMVMRELEDGLSHHSLITNQRDRERYSSLLTVVMKEYDEIVKNEVQRAITADESAIRRLAANYIDNLRAYTQHEKLKNPYTGQSEEPDERLMRSIEEKIDIPEGRKDDFRREIMNYIGALAIDGKKFEWDSNERLRKALELKLFEDQKDSIKLTSLVSSVVDPEMQEKIDVVKARLIKNFGYNDTSATDVLNYVASIFARGDVKEPE